MSDQKTRNYTGKANVAVEAPCESSSLLSPNQKNTVDALTPEKEDKKEPDKVKEGSPVISTLTASTLASRASHHPIHDDENANCEKEEENKRCSSSSSGHCKKNGVLNATRQKEESVKGTPHSMLQNGTPTSVPSSFRTVSLTSCDGDGSTSSENKRDGEKQETGETQGKKDGLVSHDGPNKVEEADKEVVGDASLICSATSPSKSSSKSASSSVSSFSCTVSSSSNFTSVKNSSSDSCPLTNSKRAKERKKRKKIKEHNSQEEGGSKKDGRDAEDRARSVGRSSRQDTEVGGSQKIVFSSNHSFSSALPTRPVSPFYSEPPQNRLVCRRNAICGLANISVLEEDFKVIEKSVEERKQLAPILLRNPLFASLDDEAIETTVDAMKVEKYAKGDVMIKEGEDCVPQLYLLLYGRCMFFRHGEAVKTVEAGGYFGEIQLMYPVASSLATVVCVEDTTVYTLHHLHYQQILVRRCLAQRDYFKQCIDSAPFLKELSECERQRLIDALSLKQFQSGELIISYGQRCVELYFLIEGKTRVIGRTDNGSPLEICIQEPGAVIGELEVLFDQSAVADVVVISTHAKLGRVSKAHLEAVLGPVQQSLLKFVAAEPDYEPYIEEYMKMHPDRPLCADIRRLKERAQRVGDHLNESDVSSDFSESDQSVHGGSERDERVEESDVLHAEKDAAAAKLMQSRILPFESSLNRRRHRETRRSDSLDRSSLPHRFSPHHSVSLFGPTRSVALHHDDVRSFPYLVSSLSAGGEIMLRLPAELVYCFSDPKQKLSRLSSPVSHLSRSHFPGDPLHDSSYPLALTKVKSTSHGARTQDSFPLFSASPSLHTEENQTEIREEGHAISKGKMKANEKKDFSLRSSSSSRHCSVLQSTVEETPLEHRTPRGRAALGERSSSNVHNESPNHPERANSDSFFGFTAHAQGFSTTLPPRKGSKGGKEGRAAALEDDQRWQEEGEPTDEEDEEEDDDDAMEEQLFGASAVPPFVRFPLSRILQFKASFIWCVREDGTILSWDSALQALTGYSSRHAIGENLFAFVEKEEEYTLLQNVIEQTIQKKKEEEEEAYKGKGHSGVASTAHDKQKSHPLPRSYSNSAASFTSTFANLSTTFSSLPLPGSHSRLGLSSQSTTAHSREVAPELSSKRRHQGKQVHSANQTIRDGVGGEGTPMDVSNENTPHSLTCHLSRLDGITSVRVELQVCAVELQTPLFRPGAHHLSRGRQGHDARWAVESGAWHERQARRWRVRSSSWRASGKGERRKGTSAHGGRRNSVIKERSEMPHERTSLVGAFEKGKRRVDHHEHAMRDSPHHSHLWHSVQNSHLFHRRRRGAHHSSTHRVVLLLGKERSVQHRGSHRAGDLDAGDLLLETRRILSSENMDHIQRLYMLEEMVENYETIQRAHNVSTEGWQPVHLRELVGKLIMDCIREQIKKNHVFHQRFENLSSEVVCIDVATLPRVLKHTLRLTAFYSNDAEVTVTVSIREHSNTKFLAFIFTTRASLAPPALVEWERLMKARRDRMGGKKQYIRRSDTFRSEGESCVLPAEEKGGMQEMNRRSSNYSELMSEKGNEFFFPIGVSVEPPRRDGKFDGMGGSHTASREGGGNTHQGASPWNEKGHLKSETPWSTAARQEGPESFGTVELSHYLKDSFDTHTWTEQQIEQQKEMGGESMEKEKDKHEPQWSYVNSSLPASLSSNQREGGVPSPSYPLPLVPVKAHATREGREKSAASGDEERSEDEKERRESVTGEDHHDVERRRGSSCRPLSLGSRDGDPSGKGERKPPFPPFTPSNTVEKSKLLNILSTGHPRFRNYLRGIRHAVEQQGGTIRISHDEDAYHLLYLFPFVPAEEEEEDHNAHRVDEKGDVEEKKRHPIGSRGEEEDGAAGSALHAEGARSVPCWTTSVDGMQWQGPPDTTPFGASRGSVHKLDKGREEEWPAGLPPMRKSAVSPPLLLPPTAHPKRSLDILPVPSEGVPHASPTGNGIASPLMTPSSSVPFLPPSSPGAQSEVRRSTQAGNLSEQGRKSGDERHASKDNALATLSDEQHTRAPSEVHSPSDFQPISSSTVVEGEPPNEEKKEAKEEGMEEAYTDIAPTWDVPTDSASLDGVSPLTFEKVHVVEERATAVPDGHPTTTIAVSDTDSSVPPATLLSDGSARGMPLQSGVTLPFSPSLPYSASTAVNQPLSEFSDTTAEKAPLPYSQEEVNRMLQKMSFTTLIAEENAVQRNLLCKFLWQRKHAVLYAVTYQEMEKLCDSVDILIIDALQFTFQNRNTLHFLLEKTRLLSVVITGDMDSAFCEAYAGSGFLVMPKPVHPNSFRSVITLAEEHILSIKKDALSIYLLRQTLSGYRMTSWTRGELLGKGTHGEVYKAISVVTGTEMAVKEMRVGQDKEKLESILTEITTMCSLQHPNIIHYFSCELTTEAVLMTSTPNTKEPEGEKGMASLKPLTPPPTSCTATHPPALLSTLSVASNKSSKSKKSRLLLASPGQGLSEPAPVNRFLRVFMEYASGGSLREYMAKNGPLEFRMYQSLLHNVVSGLAYIHANQYVHSDIKTPNILLTSDMVGKIGDFGSARRLIDGELCFQMEGSVAYMSPECLSAGEVNETGQRTGFSFPTDIWSLGVVAMEIITNQSPYSHVKKVVGPASLTQYLTTLSSETPDLSPLFLYPPCVTEFIAACLRVNPAQRATAEELLHFSLFHESSDMETMSAIKALRQAELRHTLTQFVAFQDPLPIIPGNEGYHSSEEKAVHMSSGGAAILADDSDDFFDSDTTEDSDVNSSISQKAEEDTREREMVENRSFSPQKDVPLSPFLSQKCLSYVAENAPPHPRAMQETPREEAAAKSTPFFPLHLNAGNLATPKDAVREAYSNSASTPSSLLEDGGLKKSVTASRVGDPTSYFHPFSGSSTNETTSARRNVTDAVQSRNGDHGALSSTQSAEKKETALAQILSFPSSYKSSVDSAPLAPYAVGMATDLPPPQSGSIAVSPEMSVNTPYTSSSQGSTHPTNDVEGRYAIPSHFLHPRQQSSTTVSIQPLTSVAPSTSASRPPHYTSPSKGSGPSYPHFSVSTQSSGSVRPSDPDRVRRNKKDGPSLESSAPLLKPSNPPGPSSYTNSMPGYTGTGSNGSAVSSSFVLPPTGLARGGESTKLSGSPVSSLLSPGEMGDRNKLSDWHPHSFANILRSRTELSSKRVASDAVSERSCSGNFPSFLPKEECAPSLHSPQAHSSQTPLDGGRGLANTTGSLFSEGLQKGIRLLSPSRLAPSNASFDAGSPQRDSVGRAFRSRLFPPLSPGGFWGNKQSSPSMKGQACVEDAADEMASCMMRENSRRGGMGESVVGEEIPAPPWMTPSMRKQSLAMSLQNCISTASRAFPTSRATQEAVAACSAFLGRRRTTFFSDDLTPIPPTESAADGISLNYSPSQKPLGASKESNRLGESCPSAVPLSRNPSSQPSASMSSIPYSSQGLPGSSWKIWKDGSPT